MFGAIAPFPVWFLTRRFPNSLWKVSRSFRSDQSLRNPYLTSVLLSFLVCLCSRVLVRRIELVTLQLVVHDSYYSLRPLLPRISPKKQARMVGQVQLHLGFRPHFRCVSPWTLESRNRRSSY